MKSQEAICGMFSFDSGYSLNVMVALGVIYVLFVETIWLGAIRSTLCVLSLLMHPIP